MNLIISVYILNIEKHEFQLLTLYFFTKNVSLTWTIKAINVILISCINFVHFFCYLAILDNIVALIYFKNSAGVWKVHIRRYDIGKLLRLSEGAEGSTSFVVLNV